MEGGGGGLLEYTSDHVILTILKYQGLYRRRVKRSELQRELAHTPTCITLLQRYLQLPSQKKKHLELRTDYSPNLNRSVSKRQSRDNPTEHQTSASSLIAGTTLAEEGGY